MNFVRLSAAGANPECIQTRKPRNIRIRSELTIAHLRQRPPLAFSCYPAGRDRNDGMYGSFGNRHSRISSAGIMIYQ
ncbi:MAG: hypothetical protein WAM14_22750 [Candidatus Nitrosopolaris sp.]